jgi:hypothetical protein
MILERVSVYRTGAFGEDLGQLKGEIKVKGRHGEISFYLDEEKAARIVAVIADQLVEATKEVAENITAEVLTHHTQIEHQQEGAE